MAITSIVAALNSMFLDAAIQFWISELCDVVQYPTLKWLFGACPPLKIVLAAVVLSIPDWCRPHLKSIITSERNNCLPMHIGIRESVPVALPVLDVSSKAGVLQVLLRSVNIPICTHLRMRELASSVRTCGMS